VLLVVYEMKRFKKEKKKKQSYKAYNSLQPTAYSYSIHFLLLRVKSKRGRRMSKEAAKLVSAGTAIVTFTITLIITLIVPESFPPSSFYIENMYVCPWCVVFRYEILVASSYLYFS
jgi:Flp pilus assembly protein TadB